MQRRWSRRVWTDGMPQQRGEIKDIGNRKAATGAKLLKRGEKTEPITQVKGLGITRKTDTPIGRLLGRVLVHSVWWERGQERETLEV